MTVASGGLIQATDYNNWVGPSPTTTSTYFNTVWSTGGTTAGYGQTAIGTVSVGQLVGATEWSTLVTSISNTASHQGTTITAVTGIGVGNLIVAAPLLNIPNNISNVYTGRLNAASQGTSTQNAATYGSTWTTGITFTHTVTFASGDAARYFFNAGGQLKITCTHANSTAGINLLLNNLASNVGTVVMSAPTAGTITVASSSFNGITKVGGGGNAPTISSGSGYYAMTTSNATVFTQTASTGPSGYLGTYIRVIAKSNGTQGSNGDTGSQITLYTIWDEVPDGLVAGTGSTTTVMAVPPEQTYISNSWGSITIAGTVA